MIVRKKSKVTKALIAVSFLIGIIAIATPVLAADPNRILMIDIMAKGDDLDISGATTSIIARIEFDKTGANPLTQVGFHSKIYDESGEKIYSMKGKLKDGLIISNSFHLWFIVGVGKLKTTDIDMEIEYRGVTITLPNTGGQYVPAMIFMMVSPKGEYVLGEDPEVFIWPEGGWAAAGIMVGGIPSVGGVTYLTKYMEKMIP